MNESAAPEYNSEIALEIVRQHQQLDEETFDKETEESIPFNEDFTVENGRGSKRKDIYIVKDEKEKQELKRALTHLFEGNAVHYKKRIVLEE